MPDLSEVLNIRKRRNRVRKVLRGIELPCRHVNHAHSVSHDTGEQAKVLKAMRAFNRKVQHHSIYYI